MGNRVNNDGDIELIQVIPTIVTISGFVPLSTLAMYRKKNVIEMLFHRCDLFAQRKNILFTSTKNLTKNHIGVSLRNKFGAGRAPP